MERSKAPHLLLLEALLLPPAQAEEAWQRWRASTNLDRLDADSFHLLPALSGCMENWLGEDPARAILTGICRRAWSQNQLRLKDLSAALGILREAGIERVAAIGPVLWGAVYWPSGAIRPIDTVDLLADPLKIQPAVDSLLKAGWNCPAEIPDYRRNQFYFAPAVRLQSPSGGFVRIHWRSLPNTDLALRRPEPPTFEPMPAGQVTAYTIPIEHSLVGALGGTLSDGRDWQADALSICREPNRIRWETVQALLRRRSKARTRLEELRRNWGVNVPARVTTSTWTHGMERMLATSLRAYRSK